MVTMMTNSQCIAGGRRGVARNTATPTTQATNMTVVGTAMVMMGNTNICMTCKHKNDKCWTLVVKFVAALLAFYLTHTKIKIFLTHNWFSLPSKQKYKAD